jgi:hypothetical protein
MGTFIYLLIISIIIFITKIICEKLDRHNAQKKRLKIFYETYIKPYEKRV